MTPQLVSMDVRGHHNAHLPETSARLLKGASWKEQRVVLIIPAGSMIPAKAALSHWNLLFPPNQGVVKILAQGYEVGEAYSTALQSVLAHPDLSTWEYLLTLEHDNLPPQDGVLRLIETMEQRPDLSCIGGLYFTKGPEGVAQIWGDPQDPVVNFRPQVPRADQIIECCGTGMGFNLWRLKMFKDDRLPNPLFKTLTGIEGRGIGTQDLQFWAAARPLGYRCAVDCRVKVGHLDVATDTVW